MAQAARKLMVEEGGDPVLLAFMNAPVDDRPETDDERLSVDAAKAEFQASGRGASHDEVVAAIERRRFAG